MLPDDGAMFSFCSIEKGIGEVRLWVTPEALLDDEGFKLVKAGEVSLEGKVGGIWLLCEAA